MCPHSTHAWSREVKIRQGDRWYVCVRASPFISSACRRSPSAACCWLVCRSFKKRHTTQLGCSTRRPRFGGRPPMVSYRAEFAGGAAKSTQREPIRSTGKIMLRDNQLRSVLIDRSARANIARDAKIERMNGRKNVGAYQSPN